MIPISFLSFMISTISVASATIWKLAMTHAHSLTQANAQFMHTFVNTSTFTQNFICTLMLHWMIPIYLLWPQTIIKNKKNKKIVKYTPRCQSSYTTVVTSQMPQGEQWGKYQFISDPSFTKVSVLWHKHFRHINCTGHSHSDICRQ